MAIRAILIGLGLTFCLAGCGEKKDGPVVVSAIGAAPKRVNPNLEPLDTPAEIVLEATAQGLVRFDAAGQIEPGLAQSWIVSDDGLRYTFRLAPSHWDDGSKVTARQVVERLQAVGSRPSRNPLKHLLGAVDEIVAMTDDVLEISLKAPRRNFLQLLAQPQMAILRSGQGTGPFEAEQGDNGIYVLKPRTAPDQDEKAPLQPTFLLRGERAAIAIARFEARVADYVTGGTLGDLPIARAAKIPNGALRVDPAEGLFGFAFLRLEGPWKEPAARQALSMAVDRGALATALQLPEFRTRPTLLPSDMEDFPPPALPAWANLAQAERTPLARRAFQSGERPVLRVYLSKGSGYRLLFALVRRDWRAIGVDAVAVADRDEADMMLIDEVAPAFLAPWYLRRFSCEIHPLCDDEADTLLAAARTTLSGQERLALLSEANRRLSDATFFIPVGSPVRWSLVSQRLKGFQVNSVAQHPLGELMGGEK